MAQQVLFPDCVVREDERLYVVGNGFDLHHGIKSHYSDFRNWLYMKGNSRLIGLMDVFFSNTTNFWSDVETALGDYREEGIVGFCEPSNSEDFKYDHPTQWQAGVEDSISFIFNDAMEEFRTAFNEWVRCIKVNDAAADLGIPIGSKYLTFNYTDTLETVYKVPAENVLHIHGNRLRSDDEMIIGHNKHYDADTPYGDDSILLPYQNAYSEVIKIMNEWVKDSESIIEANTHFFQSLNCCSTVIVMGYSYNEIDVPYLRKIFDSVVSNCRWILYYYSIDDLLKAKNTASVLGLRNYCLKEFV